MRNDELRTLEDIVGALAAMSEDEQRRALAYLDARFRLPASPAFGDEDVDELADVVVDARATVGAGAVSLARVVLAAGYRRMRGTRG